MSTGARVSDVDEVVDLPDVLVVWGAPTALVGVIELDPGSEVMVVTRASRTNGWPSQRLVTSSAVDAIAFLTGERVERCWGGSTPGP
jgi:hypothetical protein